METLKSIKKIVHELDPKLPESNDGYKVATILLASSMNELKKHGEVAQFTGLPDKFVGSVMSRLSANGLGWKSGMFYQSGWSDKENGGTAFWLDVNVGLGYLRTVHAK